jgi:hypothetical protein
LLKNLPPSVGLELGYLSFKIREAVERMLPTPIGDYVGTLNAIADLVLSSEKELCQKGSLGVTSPEQSQLGLVRTENQILQYW